jgi:hypothetical protein
MHDSPPILDYGQYKRKCRAPTVRELLKALGIVALIAACYFGWRTFALLREPHWTPQAEQYLRAALEQKRRNPAYAAPPFHGQALLHPSIWQYPSTYWAISLIVLGASTLTVCRRLPPNEGE